MAQGAEIAVIGPNELIREGLRNILNAQGFDVCAVAADAEDLLHNLGERRPHIVLVDGLNALGISPRDLIAILQAIKATGALQAEIEVL